MFVAQIEVNSTKSVNAIWEAKSKEVMPATFDFTCIPYEGLSDRTFRLRYSIITSDKPILVLRIVQLEANDEEIAVEFRDLLVDKFKDVEIECFIGKFNPDF